MPEEGIANLLSKCPLSHAMSGSCDHNGGVLINEGGDLKLTIPQGAIKDEDEVIFCTASDLFGPGHLYSLKLPSSFGQSILLDWSW